MGFVVIRVRFYGQSSPINGDPQEWDYTKEYPSDVEAGEAITDYLTEHDDDPLASYEVL